MKTLPYVIPVRYLGITSSSFWVLFQQIYRTSFVFMSETENLLLKYFLLFSERVQAQSLMALPASRQHGGAEYSGLF